MPPFPERESSILAKLKKKKKEKAGILDKEEKAEPPEKPTANGQIHVANEVKYLLRIFLLPWHNNIFHVWNVLFIACLVTGWFTRKSICPMLFNVSRFAGIQLNSYGALFVMGRIVLRPGETSYWKNMDLKTRFKRSAICVGVNVVQSGRHGSLSSFHSVTCTRPSIRAFVNKDSCNFQVPAPNPALQAGEIFTWINYAKKTEQFIKLHSLIRAFRLMRKLSRDSTVSCRWELLLEYRKVYIEHSPSLPQQAWNDISASHLAPDHMHTNL